MFWTIIIILILFIAFYIPWSSGETKKNEQKLTVQGYRSSSRIETAKYIAGHPYIHKEEPLTVIYPKNGQLILMRESPLKETTRLGKIEISSIRSIAVEDRTTVERRVTLTRALLLGIFALAWQKKKTHECAYLVIEWVVGLEVHETMFEFEGPSARLRAGKAKGLLASAS
ncbi:MAG: hypothetical protein ACKOQ6_02220 [Bacteroidota bacterium]